MADLSNHMIYKNTKFEILTDEGFKDFKGLIVGKNPKKISLGLQTGNLSSTLICTPKHKLILNNKACIYAKDIKPGTILHNKIKVVSIKSYEDETLVYEFLEISDVHRYFANNVLCHQCLIIDEMAHIPDHILKEFWTSVIPVISSSRDTKIFAVSTPNGTGNLFHKIYTETERGELSQWHYDKIDWWEIPGRNAKWKEEMEGALAGEGRSFDQEFGNVFLETGQSAVDAELITHLREIARPPISILEDGHYKIWKEPILNHIYAIGVDVGEGVGQAASVAQVLDLTDLTDIELVASYHNNQIDPFHFAELLYKITHQWGRPNLLIERNNCGGQVVDALKEVHKYNNIVDYTPENQKYYNRLGIYSHSNSKYKGVTNMRYWMNSLRVVSIYDIATTHELETFVKYPNGTWKKKAGDYIYDDRVMSLVWALLALEPEITERYYEIVQSDERGKPLKIAPFDIVAPEYFKLDSFFQRDSDAPLPAFIGAGPGSQMEDELKTLRKQGWKPYG